MTVIAIFGRQRLEEHKFQSSLGYIGFYLRNRKGGRETGEGREKGEIKVRGKGQEERRREEGREGKERGEEREEGSGGREEGKERLNFQILPPPATTAFSGLCPLPGALTSLFIPGLHPKTLLSSSKPQGKEHLSPWLSVSVKFISRV